MDTPAGQMHVIYRWKSIYVFSPQLVKRLSDSLELDSVNCEFDSIGQAYILDGERDDVLRALEKLRNLVDKEYQQARRNRGNNSLIQRSRLSEFTSSPVVWNENVDDEAETSIKTVNDSEFSLMKYWSPVMGTDFASMLHPQDIEDDVPTMIERVCDCRIEKDTFARRLNIRANDPYVIERVIEKLNKVEEIFNAKLIPMITYLVYVDDHQDFELKLVSLKAQIRTNGKTTLFGDKAKRYYRDRTKIYSLRILRRVDNVAKPMVVPLEINQIPGRRNGDGPRAWKDYQFQGHGTFENDPSVYVKPRAVVRLQSPIPQLDLQSHANNLSRALGKALGKPMEELLDTDAGFNLGPRPNFTTQEDLESTDFLLGPRPNFASLEEKPAAMPVTARRRVKELDEPNTQSQSPHTVQTSPSNLPQRGPVEYTRRPEATEAVSSAGPSAFLSSSSSYQGGKVGGLLGPRESKNSLPARPSPHLNITSSGIVRTTRRVRVTEDLVPEEATQKSSEQETRDIRNVNSQRAPRRDALRRYNFEEHQKFSMETMREAFMPGFDYARLHKCRIIFEARIGRVLYDNAPPPTKCMNWDDFIPILDDRRDTMKALFTDRVTTDSVDVDHVCDLKLGPDQNFFNYEPDKKKIWYEFLCDYKGKPCNIKFDAETGEMEVLGRLDTYGTVFWNCPLRSWDSRFVLQARKVLSSEEPAFRYLCESIFVPHGTQLPDISFRTESNNIMVKKVYCKREARYLVLPNSLTGPRRNFEFCVTEVQDLWIQAHTASDETFKAIATERPDMIANERLHYSFSLVPSRHREIFNTQTQLEIGEVPQWTGSSLLENGLLQAMVGIINALVQRMDNVGFNNRGAWSDGL